MSGALMIATLLLAASLMALMPPASSAQAVPIPQPAPTDRGTAQTGAQRSPLTTATTSVLPPDPIIPDPNRSVPVDAFPTFNAKQKAEAAKVSAWLSSVQTLVGNFIQVGPDGTKTKGEFYIQKPGKVR
ncbi:MAG: outer-membrane lipoprotein carrier protein LolA, partial [Bradyrhizobium sp.]